ncbi:MAG TPA: N-acetyltransferase [Terriglobales bacterium]|nr:N-acetyltransferase [Terriglobales bacterium]
MRFRIRDFRKEEFELLWAIDQECFPPGISYTRMELTFYMRRTGAFTLVAQSEPEALGAKGGRQAGKPTAAAASQTAGDILGFIVGEVSARGAGHIITIDVRAGARRYGVGTALLQAAEARLRGAGSRHVFLETAVNNAAAIAFYKRHSYELIRTIPRYYKNSLDALLLGKRLAAEAGKG